MVLELLAAGKSTEEILQDYYPSLSPVAIKAAMQYAAKRLQNEEVVFSTKTKTSHAISL